MKVSHFVLVCSSNTSKLNLKWRLKTWVGRLNMQRPLTEAIWKIRSTLQKNVEQVCSKTFSRRDNYCAKSERWRGAHKNTNSWNKMEQKCCIKRSNFTCNLQDFGHFVFQTWISKFYFISIGIYLKIWSFIYTFLTFLFEGLYSPCIFDPVRHN